MLKLVRDNGQRFLNLYKAVMDGDVCSPRGSEIKEVRNYSFSIDPNYPFTSFVDRNLNTSYLAAELHWYLVGDRYDISICNFGSTWKNLIQKDGGLNSNYGQTIFGVDNQFDWVCEELIRDPSSRRAVLIIGEKSYLDKEVNDQRCCQFIQFMIRNDELQCYVYFRSNDAVWGVSNDVFTLVEIFKYVYAVISQYMPKLKLGLYNHTAASMHVYEKHYDMLEKIIKKGMRGFYEVDFASTSNPSEYEWLRNNRSGKPPEYYSYATKLMEMKNE